MRRLRGDCPRAFAHGGKVPWRAIRWQHIFDERGTKWLDQRTWSEEMESYVDTSVLAALRRKRPSGTVEANFRPICLNFWLQSARRVRYNLDAEVRNG